VITAIASDPGDRWAVLGTDAGDLYVIDIAQRTVAQRPTRHSDRPVRELVVSPLGEAVAVCDWAGRTRVYHVPTTAPLTPPFELPEPVVSLAWRGDGQRLAAATETGDGTVWDVSAVTSRRMFDPTSRGCALSPDRRRLASWGPELETRVWDVTRLPTAPVARLRDVGAATAQWHPDGDRLAIVSKQQADGAAVDIRLWEVRAAQITRVPLQQSHDWRPSFIGLEFVGQGEQLVFGGTCGPVIVDVGSGAEILQATLRTPPAFVPYCCAVSDRFVAACRRFTVTTEVNCLRVWTPAGAVAYETVLPARLRVKGLAWSPDGSHLAAHGEFGLLMWRTRDWQPVPLSGEVAESTVELLAFDPAGRRVALVDDNAVCRVVPVETPLQRGREFCIASRPRQLSFSRDGKRLAVVTYAQGVTVWDWWRGQPLCPPLRSDTQLTQATFAADDTALIVSHRPGGLEWIAVPPAPSDSPDELVRVAQRATGFSLAEGMPPQFMTADQWHRLASRSTPPRE
jgi:WD40 repeat protein